MSEKTTQAYAKKIDRVCDYIHAHLDEDLSLERLAGVANFSKYHFHRQFSGYTGTGVCKYVQLLRLQRAAHQLALVKHYRIIDIALEAGFQTPEAFSRAFKKLFGQTPSQFRKQPEWGAWPEKHQLPKRQGRQAMKVDVIDFPATRVAVLAHRGSPDLIKTTVSRFIDWRKESGLSPVKSSQTYGIAYDDPATTPADEFRFDLCGSVTGDVPDNPQGVTTGFIPGGRCAVLRHTGAHAEMSAKVYYLYGDWLPQSGEQLRDFPCFFQYYNFLTEVPEEALITDIYLPLQ